MKQDLGPGNKIDNAAKVFLTQKEGEEGGQSRDNPEKLEENASELDFGNPKQIVELLKRLDDATIFLIHNTQEKEEDLEKTKRAFKQQRQQIEKKYNDRKESLNQVQKLFDKLDKVINMLDVKY